MIVYVWVHITWEFSLVPPYWWHSALTSLTCYVCTFFLSVSDIYKYMFDCCKYIFKLIMNDWSMVLLDLGTCIDLCLYISSHFFSFSKELYKCQSLKRESWKSLASKTTLTRKMWSKFVLKCMVPKPNAYLSKIYKKFMASFLKNLSCIWSKVWNMKANWKLSIKCKHIG